MSVKITTLDGILIEEAHLIGALLHRDGAPAHIIYYETGEIKEISYYQNGRRHSEGLDITRTTYYKNGIVASRCFYENDKFNDRNGTAARREYYDDGTCSNICYINNNVFHSVRGPATSSFYKNGRPKLGEYIVDGFRHREDGPAVISYHEDGTCYHEYWLTGYQYSDQRDWLAAVQASKVQVKQKAVYNGKGSNCRKCKVFYDYAEPDDDDGMIECWGCKNIR